MFEIKERVALALRALADRISPPVDICPSPAAVDFDADNQVRHAQQLCNEIKLRRALDEALNRYSPIRLPAQA